VWASPRTFVAERWTDWLASLPEPQLHRLHFRVLRWSLDEMALPRQLFEEVVEQLYREDQFARGALLIRARRAAPELVDAPMLNVIESRSRVVPPQSVLPFHEAARSTERQVLWYEGDIGVALQHVGMLVGRHAHQNLWPKILSWIHSHSNAG
jgi:polyhydroxyalkanoate synthase